MEGEHELHANAAALGPDEEARKQYKEKLEDVSERLEEAERHNDPGTAEKLREEKDFLARELGQVTRRRDLGKPVRDRTTHALKYSLKKVGEKLPALKAHLDRALQRGPVWCYRADLAEPWQF